MPLKMTVGHDNYNVHNRYRYSLLCVERPATVTTAMLFKLALTVTD